MMKKKILILGAGNAQIDLIKYCKRIDLEVYGVSYTNTDKGIPLLDHFEQINIIDKEAVLNYVLENQIDYIYSVGSDIAVPTFTYVSEKANKFSFISSKTAEICCNKNLMRIALGKNSVYNVPFCVVSSLDEPVEDSIYPAMMKPVDSQGQRGIFKVNSLDDVKRFFNKSLEHSKSGKVIIEKYIDGKEVSVNAYVKDGKVIFSLLSDRESFENLPGGIIKAHHIPSRFEGTEVHERTKLMIADIISKLEINNGPVYFQIKISDDRPYVLEVAPRLDGCHMWRLIEQYCGVNLLKTTMEHFISGTAEMPEMTKMPFGIHTEFFCEAPGTVFDASKYESYFGGYKELYYKTGDTVAKMNGYMEKCGYRIFKSPYKVGIVGGSGMIGKSLMQELGGKGIYYKDVSRTSGAVSDYGVDELSEALKDCDSAVILAAKKVNPKEEQSYSLYEANPKITENVILACQKSGIKNVVYMSSRCVYSNMQACPISETGVVEPINFYGVSKYAGEMICDFYNRNYDMNIKILRLSQVIGNDENGFMINTFIQNACLDKEICVYGKSVGKRDYIYVKDAVKAIVCALEAYALSETYNIGSGVGTTNLALAEAIKYGFRSGSEIVSCTDKPEDTSISYLNIQCAEKELKFKCTYSLEEAFADLKSERNIQ